MTRYLLAVHTAADGGGQAADLDAALGWARRVSAIIGMPIEVRPFAATAA